MDRDIYLMFFFVYLILAAINFQIGSISKKIDRIIDEKNE